MSIDMTLSVNWLHKHIYILYACVGFFFKTANKKMKKMAMKRNQSSFSVHMTLNIENLFHNKYYLNR